jgi:hypothetical protein
MELIKNIVANLELLWHEAYASCQNLLISEKLAEFLELRDISAQRLFFDKEFCFCRTF